MPDPKGFPEASQQSGGRREVAAQVTSIWAGFPRVLTITDSQKARLRDNLQAEDLGLGDGLDLANFAENGVGDLAVKADQRHSVGAACRLPTSERERGDVDAEASQRAANVADDARLIVVAQEKD